MPGSLTGLRKNADAGRRRTAHRSECAPLQGRSSRMAQGGVVEEQLWHADVKLANRM